jgi:hypothetical protein
VFARRAVEFKDSELTGLFSSLLKELNLKDTIRLLRSEGASMPMVCGILRPVVLLPANAEEWSEERQRMVLLHELAHVARRDCLIQMLAQAVCAFYWFNPLVWHTARRLRIEREKACDDYVVRIGAKPSEYAGHLLEIARSMQDNRSVFEWSQTASVAMARRSQLEGRLLSILSEENKRGTVSGNLALGLAALICVLLISLAVVRPTAINAQKSQNSETVSKIGEKSSPGSVSAIDLEQTNAVTDVGYGQQSAQQHQDNSTDFIEEMASVGYTNLSVDELIKLKSAGVTTNYVSALRELGFANLTVRELASMSINDVTPAYIRALRADGLTELSVKEVISLRIRDVTPEFIRNARSLQGDISLKQIISLKDEGNDDIPPPAPPAPPMPPVPPAPLPKSPPVPELPPR